MESVRPEMLEEKLREESIPGESFSLYGVLDGASIPDLRMQIYKLEPESECLFEGELEPDMQEVAPYLVSLQQGHPFTDWVLSKAWGQHWGIFVQSQANMQQMLQHCRKFIVVYDETGKPLRFRYYDPRVLPTFLPTCNKDELSKFFGPVQRILMEGESPETMLTFECKTGELKRQEVSLAGASPAPAR